MIRKTWIIGIGSLVLGAAAPAHATLWSLAATLSPSSEVPPHGGTGAGTFGGTLDDVSGALTYNLTFSGLASPATASHIHGPAAVGVNGPVFFPITEPNAKSGFVSGSGVLTNTQIGYILGGLSYVNVHDAEFPGGEIRGQISESQRAVPGPAAVLPFIGGALVALKRRKRR